jgi:cytochrome b561
MMDSSLGYGRVTRALHWSMAVLFALQFSSAALHLVAEASVLEKIFWPTHRPVGFTLFLLALVRGSWGLANLRRRPPHDSRLTRIALAGHLSAYGLMIAVPSFALLRAYGNGRGFSFFGQQVVPATGRRTERLTQLGDTLHGELAWCLLLLVGAHATMALVHHFVFRDATLVRMTRGAP